MQNRRTHYFTEGKVITGLLPSGQYAAHLFEADFETDGGRVRGYGHTRFAAIADLNEAIGTAEPEEVDHRAARFDYARDLRKNWEPAQ